ncbi:MAG: cyclic-di-AMP receptor [Tissierellia bacterium]|nr:cyclic-di-AMP receptor [Tissierellia bacterium]
MKLIISIVQDVDADSLIEHLTESGFRVTKMSSTGGFLKSGNTTLLTGVNDEDFDKVMALIEENSKTREVTRTIQPMNIPGQAMVPVPLKVKVGGATIFVLNVEQYKRY